MVGKQATLTHSHSFALTNSIDIDVLPDGFVRIVGIVTKPFCTHSSSVRALLIRASDVERLLSHIGQIRLCADSVLMIEPSRPPPHLQSSRKISILLLQGYGKRGCLVDEAERYEDRSILLR